MLKVTRLEKSGRVTIRLEGMVDENTQFFQEIGPLPQEIDFICRDITQINSFGVKAWMEFFTQAAANRVRFTFHECSPAVVRQINYMSGFTCGGTVVSLSVPFICQSCHRELRGLVQAADLKKASFRLPAVRCPSCQTRALFDDVPERFFAFLIRDRAEAA